MSDTRPITIGHLTVDELRSVLTDRFTLALTEEARDKIAYCRQYLEDKIAQPGARFYGINTGFGQLCDVEIEADKLS